MSDPTLAELCTLIADSEHKTAPKDPSGQHPLVRTTDLGNARVDFARAQRVNSDTYMKWTRRGKPSTGDLILAREAPVGGVARVPDGVHPVLGQRTVLLRPGRAVDGRFLMYRLAAADLQARMNEMATGSTVPHLNMSDIRAFEIPNLPEPAEQVRRAAVLAAIDELIATNERRIELLQNLARSLYREWFVRLRFPGHNAVSTTSQAACDWLSTRLGDVVSVNELTAKAKELPDPLEYIDISAVGQRRIEGATVMSSEAAPSRARRRVRDGDTLWAMVRPNRRAHALVHDPIENAIASTGLAVLSPKSVPASFLFELTSRQEFTDYLVGRATGSAYPAVRPADFEEAPIVVPPDSLLDAFDAAASPALRLASRLLESNRALSRTRDLILSRLVTGLLDISDIDLGDLPPTEAV